MTRPRSDVERVLKLAEEGRSFRSISMETGVSRPTIRSWVSDPDWALTRLARNGKECGGECQPRDGLEGSKYSYLLGMYLGDGTISEHPKTYRLRIFCDWKYPQIMDEVAAAIHSVSGSKPGRTKRDGCDEVNAYSCHWPCYFPQHGPGMKHQRKIELADWQREIVITKPRPFIRGLIQSDGCRFMNVAVKHGELAIERYTYTRYQFTNKSDDIRGLFCWALDLIGVHWTRSNQWTISVARRKDVHHLDSFVGPKR